MSRYICESCLEVKNPDDLYPTPVTIIITGRKEYFLLCADCRVIVEKAEKLELNPTKERADQFAGIEL